jgi:hypothetical protein
VSGAVLRTQPEYVLEQRNGIRAAGFVLQLSCSFESRKIIGGRLQGFLIGTERRLLLSFA